VRRAERENAGVVNQDVDMAASQLDGPSRDRTGARSVAKAPNGRAGEVLIGTIPDRSLCSLGGRHAEVFHQFPRCQRADH
jgi:hypothetical protein